MKIGLISTYSHPIAIGLRYVSSALKTAGHEVTVLFFSSKRPTAKVDFSEKVLDECAERLQAVDLIGVSLMTNTFNRACAITEYLRKAGLGAPIVWGGVHATLAPEESIQVADVVCIGEGERQMVELVDTMQAGNDPTRIEGLWFRRDGKVIENPARALQTDLDAVPFPDYELENQWVAIGDTWELARAENMRGALNRYRLETTRGCPYSCAFCNNTALRIVHEDKGAWVRTRSNENVIQELESVVSRFPSVEEVNIVDDLFFIRSPRQLEEFADLYCKRVGLPLEVDAHPNTVNREKLRTLSRLPISLVSMGIQSGSERTLFDLYDRRTPLKRIVAAMDAISEFKLPAEYHYIVDNPYEPDEGRIETLCFAATHHRGRAALRIFPLQFYPGTPLYVRAKQDGIIGERHGVAYTQAYGSKEQYRGNDYLTIWLRVVLSLRNIHTPRWLVHGVVDVVTSRPVRFVLERPWFPPVAYGCYRVGRTIWKNLIFQPFIRPFRYLRRKPHRGSRPASPTGARSGSANRRVGGGRPPFAG